ncbi:unnamed protein product [Timema podura]|uniref:Uncharacterized protein n=1 Tax=Timema podura TaxID=61482 RepID=A0ABN7PMR1_TIMPD|nr:unnamed protein product [Timema podura]
MRARTSLGRTGPAKRTRWRPCGRRLTSWGRIHIMSWTVSPDRRKRTPPKNHALLIFVKKIRKG